MMLRSAACAMCALEPVSQASRSCARSGCSVAVRRRCETASSSSAGYCSQRDHRARLLRKVASAQGFSSRASIRIELSRAIDASAWLRRTSSRSFSPVLASSLVHRDGFQWQFIAPEHSSSRQVQAPSQPHLLVSLHLAVMQASREKDGFGRNRLSGPKSGLDNRRNQFSGIGADPVNSDMPLSIVPNESIASFGSFDSRAGTRVMTRPPP